MPEDELERKLALLEAAWRFFDEVAERVSPEMLKGPRGGGRNRDEIVRCFTARSNRQGERHD